MIYLVDYENVKTAGMFGCSFVNSTDEVDIFFSESANRIMEEQFSTIADLGCRINVFKLKTIGKNALDFYIATRFGELIGKGSRESIAIISKDKGYKAVKEFWHNIRNIPNKIVLSHSIADAYAQENEVLSMQNKYPKRMQQIESLYQGYKLQEELRSRLKELFDGTGYETCIEEIVALVNSKDSLGSLYRNSLKKFGRKDGTDIYRRLKLVV